MLFNPAGGFCGSESFKMKLYWSENQAETRTENKCINNIETTEEQLDPADNTKQYPKKLCIKDAV